MKFIDFEVTIDNLESDVKKLYTIIRPNSNYEDIEYSEFKEGVMNSIIRLDDPKSKDPIVIRSYNLKLHSLKKKKSDDEDGFDISKFQNRKLELTALERASELDISMKIFANYQNGFIYKFIDGDVNSVELYNSHVARKTAIKMARLHNMDMGDLVSKEPAVLKFLDKDSDFSKLKNNFDERQKQHKHEIFNRIIPIFSSLEQEYERLHHLVLKNNAYGPIVFCHNDLNKTNLLIEKTSKEPIFIDFEWCGTNYQMYDISYHLCNMAGSFCQYFNADHVPNKEFIVDWLRSYYEEWNKLNSIQMNDQEFNEMIENEVKKVIVNMLSIRIQLITRAMFFELDPSNKHTPPTIKDYCLSIYNDFVKCKDEHLKLLDTIV